MRFDLALKKVVATNVTLFGNLMEYFDKHPGESHPFLASLCKVGLQNNFYIGKTLEKMEFLPGDDASIEAEERIMGEAVEREEDEEILRGEYQPAEPKKLIEIPKLEQGPDKSLDELLKIVNTPDYPVLDIKEILSGEHKQPEGHESPSSPRADVERAAQDWYASLYGNKSGQSLPGKDVPSADSPKDGPSQEGQ